MTRNDVPPVETPAADSKLPSSTDNSNGAASCVTLKACPPTEIVPVRGIGCSFAATVKLIEPFPCVPLANSTLMKESLITGVHSHSEAVAMVKLPEPPLAGKFRVVGISVKAQPLPKFWEIVTVCPATVRVPVRAEPVVGETVKLTVPVPVLTAPELIVRKLELLIAVHPQPVDVSTVIVPVPPEAVKAELGVETRYVQLPMVKILLPVAVCPSGLMIVTDLLPALAATVERFNRTVVGVR